MRIPLVIILSLVLVSVPVAQIVTIKTDPPGLGISVDGEYIGKAPVTVEKRFGNTVTITVAGEGIEEFNLYAFPPDLYQHKIIEIDAEKGIGISRSGIFRPEKPANAMALAVLGGLVLLTFVLLFALGAE